MGTSRIQWWWLPLQKSPLHSTSEILIFALSSVGFQHNHSGTYSVEHIVLILLLALQTCCASHFIFYCTDSLEHSAGLICLAVFPHGKQWRMAAHDLRAHRSGLSSPIFLKPKGYLGERLQQQHSKFGPPTSNCHLSNPLNLPHRILPLIIMVHRV